MPETTSPAFEPNKMLCCVYLITLFSLFSFASCLRDHCVDQTRMTVSLVDSRIGGQKVQVLITVHVPNVAALGFRPHHGKRMIRLRSKRLFTLNHLPRRKKYFFEKKKKKKKPFPILWQMFDVMKKQA